jgi:hypothetical protein
MLRLLIAMLALTLPATAHAAWHEASTPHFVVYSDARPESVRAFADKLERFDSVLRVLLRLPDEPVGRANRLTVYVVNNAAAVQRLAGKGGENVYGFYSPARGRIGRVHAPTFRQRQVRPQQPDRPVPRIYAPLPCG